MSPTRKKKIFLWVAGTLLYLLAGLCVFSLYAPQIPSSSDFRFSLEQVRAIPFVNEKKAKINPDGYERNEQNLAYEFVSEDDVVLELGARYGVVSSIINQKLKNQAMHVVVEPDSSVIPALRKNRKTHNSFFRIFDGVISERPKVFVEEGLGSFTPDASPGDSKLLKRITLDVLVKEQGREFTFLFADCEGCLCSFLEENKRHIPYFRMIVMEKDKPSCCDYGKIEQLLASEGFARVRDGIHAVWKKR